MMKSNVIFLAFLMLLVNSLAGYSDDGSSINWQPANEPGGGGWVVALSISPFDSSRVIASGDMLSAALSTDRGLTWSPTFGFNSYEMCDITWHPQIPDIVWMGTLTGPYISVDGGKNWEMRRNGMPELSYWSYSCPIEKVLFVPGSTDHLLAISGSSRHWGNVNQFRGIWESTDSGNNWKFICNLTDDGMVHQEGLSGKNIYRAVFAGGVSHTLYVVSDGVWMSKDIGKSWQQCNNGLPGVSEGGKVSYAQIGTIQAHPKDENVLWVSVKAYWDNSQGHWKPGGIYKTTDGGSSWFSISDGLTQDISDRPELASSYPSMAVSPANPDIIWTGDASYRHCLVYKSQDGGQHWQAVARKGEAAGKQGTVQIVPTACFAGSGMTGFTADPTDEQTVYGWCSEYVLRTIDGGYSWIDTMSYQPKKDSPQHWRGRGWTGWCSKNVGFNPYKKGQCILQGMDASRGWLTDDNFNSYRYVSTDPVAWMAGNDTAFTKDGGIYIATGQFGGFAGIICSSDFGKSFTTYYGSDHGLPDMSWDGQGNDCLGVYANPLDSKKVWAAIGGRLYYSANSGKNWEIVNDQLGLMTMEGDPIRPGCFYAAGKEGVYYIEGDNIKSIGGPCPGGRGRLDCDSLGRLYVCQFRDGISGLWRFSPDKEQWERLLDESLAIQCDIDPVNPDRLLLVTSQDPYNDHAGGNGIWISSDAGKSWHSENEDLPMLRCNTAAFDPFDHEKIVVGSYGAGFYMASWPESYQPKGDRSYTMTKEDITLVEQWVLESAK